LPENILVNIWWPFTRVMSCESSTRSQENAFWYWRKCRDNFWDRQSTNHIGVAASGPTIWTSTYGL